MSDAGQAEHLYRQVFGFSYLTWFLVQRSEKNSYPRNIMILQQIKQHEQRAVWR